MGNILLAPKRGGIFYAVTLILFSALSVIGQSILFSAGATDRVLYSVTALFPAVVLGAAYLFYFQSFGAPSYAKQLPHINSLLPTLLLAFGMFAGLGWLNLTVSGVVERLGGKVATNKLPLETPFDLILFSVLLCVLPAVFEELFFRGILLGSLSGTGKTASVFTVALCFALYHGNVSQLFYQFIYGVGLGLLTLTAKSLLPAVLSHFLNNFVVLTLEYCGVTGEIFFYPLLIVLGAVSISAFAVFTALSLRKSKSADKSANKQSIKDFYLPFGIIGIVFAAVMVILAAIPFSA